MKLYKIKTTMQTCTCTMIPFMLTNQFIFRAIRDHKYSTQCTYMQKLLSVEGCEQKYQRWAECWWKENAQYPYMCTYTCVRSRACIVIMECECTSKAIPYDMQSRYAWAIMTYARVHNRTAVCMTLNVNKSFEKNINGSIECLISRLYYLKSSINIIWDICKP